MWSKSSCDQLPFGKYLDFCVFVSFCLFLYQCVDIGGHREETPLLLQGSGVRYQGQCGITVRVEGVGHAGSLLGWRGWGMRDRR